MKSVDEFNPFAEIRAKLENIRDESSVIKLIEESFRNIDLIKYRSEFSSFVDSHIEYISNNQNLMLHSLQAYVSFCDIFPNSNYITNAHNIASRYNYFLTKTGICDISLGDLFGVLRCYIDIKFEYKLILLFIIIKISSMHNTMESKKALNIVYNNRDLIKIVYENDDFYHIGQVLDSVIEGLRIDFVD